MVEALGPMSHLLPSEKLEEQLPRLVPGLLALYKKPAEAYHVSKVRVCGAALGVEGLLSLGVLLQPRSPQADPAWLCACSGSAEGGLLCGGPGWVERGRGRQEREPGPAGSAVGVGGGGTRLALRLERRLGWVLLAQLAWDCPGATSFPGQLLTLVVVCVCVCVVPPQSLCQILEASVDTGSRTLDVQLDTLLQALHLQVREPSPAPAGGRAWRLFWAGSFAPSFSEGGWASRRVGAQQATAGPGAAPRPLASGQAGP